MALMDYCDEEPCFSLVYQFLRTQHQENETLRRLSLSSLSPRILTQKFLFESLGYWTHKTQRSWQLATHFNPYEIRLLDWWSYLDTGTHLRSDISVVVTGEKKRRRTFTNLIHNTQGLQYVQGDSAGKFSPSVVYLCSTSAQIGQKAEKNKEIVVVVKNWVICLKKSVKNKGINIFRLAKFVNSFTKMNIERILS